MSLKEKCYKNKKMFTSYRKVDNVIFDNSKFILLLYKFANLFIINLIVCNSVVMKSTHVTF